MTRILKRPADAASSMRLPVRSHDPRRPGRAMPADVRPEPDPAVDAERLKAELRTLREQAIREGLAQGRAQAESEVRAALEAELKQWRSGLEALEAAVSKKLQAIESLAVTIGFEAFASVLGEAYLRRDALEQSVRQLVAAAAASPALTIHVAPDQLERVRAALECSHRAGLQFDADAGLSGTECRVSSVRGEWETGLALQLQVIQEACLHAVEAGAKEAQS